MLCQYSFPLKYFSTAITSVCKTEIEAFHPCTWKSSLAKVWKSYFNGNELNGAGKRMAQVVALKINETISSFGKAFLESLFVCLFWKWLGFSKLQIKIQKLIIVIHLLCPCTALPQILPAKAKDCCWPNDLRRAIWRCFDFLNFKADFERTCSSTDTTDLKIFCLDGYMSTFAKKSFCGKWRITLTLQIKLWLKRQGQHMYKQKRSCWKCTVSNLNTGQEKQRNKVKSNKETKLNQTKKQSWIKQRKKETKLNERQSLSCSCSNPDFTGLV